MPKILKSVKIIQYYSISFIRVLRCDTELGTNEQTRKEKTNAVETLHSEIDELTATIAKLGQEISDLSVELSEANKASFSHFQFSTLKFSQYLIFTIDISDNCRK